MVGSKVYDVIDSTGHLVRRFYDKIHALNFLALGGYGWKIKEHQHEANRNL